MQHRLDALGLICPLPVLKARKVLLSLPKGAVLTIVVSDENAPKDFGLFCAENNYTYEGVTKVTKGFEIVVRK